MRVAFLGAGIMGREMALRLLKSGHRVTVYNRTKEKTLPLVKAGARAAPTPAQAVAGAQIAIAMVGDDKASRQVWDGVRGALRGKAAPNAIAVESSTVSFFRIRELGRKARGAGWRFIDCPVTGGPDGAREGRLTLLAGADPDTLDEAREVFSSYGRRIIHFGPPGSGTAYKLMVNLVGAAQATSLAEGLILAERIGLDVRKVRQAVRTGAIASPLVKYLTQRMTEAGHQEVYFSARWRHKDARYGLQMGRAFGLRMPTCLAAEACFRKAVSAGLGDKNSSVVIEAIRRRQKKITR